jgi:hypothetical protein
MGADGAQAGHFAETILPQFPRGPVRDLPYIGPPGAGINQDVRPLAAIVHGYFLL